MLGNQKGSSAAEVLLKFCLVFVISLFAFAVGTFVGKKFTEDQQRLTAIDNLDQQGQQKRQAASVADLSESIEPENKLSDADIQSLTEEFSAIESEEITNAMADRGLAEEEVEELANKALKELDKDLENIKKKDENKSGATNKSSNKEDHPTLVAKRIAINEDKVVVAPKEIADRRPASYPKLQAASSAGKYTVQVASYQSEEEAKAYVSELNTQGYTSFFVEAKVNGKMWYRVSVGLFQTKEKANDFMKELYQEAKLKGFITQIKG